MEGDYGAYRVIREIEPTLYEEVRGEMASAEQRGEGEAGMLNAARTSIGNYVSANLMLVPDEVLVQVIAVNVKEAQAVSQHSAEICVELMTGRLAGDIQPYLPPELLVEEMAALEALVRAPKVPDRPALSQGDVQMLALNFIERKWVETGIPFGEFTIAGTGQIEAGQACRALFAFHAGIVPLPVDRAAAMLRAGN